MTEEIVTYSHTGCPYGDRLRLALSLVDIDESDICQDNEFLSGSMMVNGDQVSGIINVGIVLEEAGKRFFPAEPSKRERQVKLAKLFELKLTRMFDRALESNIHRGESFYMFMESLSVFENELIRCGRFFGGAEIGFLDIVLYPWISRIGIWTPEFLKGELTRLQSWRRRMKDHLLIQSDSKRGTRSDLLRYAKKLRGDDDHKYKLQRLNSCGL